MALRIEQLLSQLLGRAAPGIQTEDPMLTSVLQWFGSVQATALDQWRVVARTGARCTLRRGNGAMPIPCEHVAVGPCSICRDFVCLPHSSVSMGGTITCLRCMAEFGQVVRERVHARPHPKDPSPPPPPHAAPPPRPATDEVALRKKHLGVLGLREPSTWDEVHAKFRKLALKHHPDRAPAGKREQAHQKMALISASYNWLNEHMRKVA